MTAPLSFVATGAQSGAEAKTALPKSVPGLRFAAFGQEVGPKAASS